MATMTSLFISADVTEGVMVEYVARGFNTINPSMYRQLVIMGGFAAIKTKGSVINFPGAIHRDQQIAILEEFRDILTPDEFGAMMEHELAHIRNKDLENVPKGSGSGYAHLEMEVLADKAGAAKYGPAVMKSAIEKSQRHQIKVLTTARNEKVLNFLSRFMRTKIMKKRLQALDAMM